jgi:hypothetical protein
MFIVTFNPFAAIESLKNWNDIVNDHVDSLYTHELIPFEIPTDTTAEPKKKKQKTSMESSGSSSIFPLSFFNKLSNWEI